MTPNALAWLALASWPVLVLGVYSVQRDPARLARTTAWMLLLPVMFLPAVIELPFAALNKHRIAFLSVGAALALLHGRELAPGGRWRHVPLFLLGIAALGAFLTVRSNRDPLTFGILELPGLGPRDGVWIVYGVFVDAFLPFAIGQRVFRTERDLRDLLEVLGKAALLYVPLCLLEIRLSPQLSNWVYGYFPHSFAQVLRGEGYRPVVFMTHGLGVAMFLVSGLCAALTLRRAGARPSPSPGFTALAVAGVLLLGRSFASIVYAGTAFLLLSWASLTTRARVVTVLTLVAVAYPALRAADAFPVEEFGRLSGAVSAERGESLAFRFAQEDILLARAMQRPLFGWGGWGRNRVYHWWGERGDEWAGAKDSSVTDGAWIVLLGGTGIVGLVAWFGFLWVPLLVFASRRAALPAGTAALASGLAVLLALMVVDLLPNSHADFLAFVYAGALLAACGGPAAYRRAAAPPAQDAIVRVRAGARARSAPTP